MMRYSISKETLDKVIAALRAHQFETVGTEDDYDEFNVEDIGEALALLESEMRNDLR